MSFVYPSFLLALLALSIPVIIHLFNFRRFKTIYFTNVRFLKNVQEETATRNRLKQLLILISRLLALAFLIFAFAQPFIPAKNQAAKSTSKAVSIYVDNSFSMEASYNDIRLLDLAKIKAGEIVNGYTIDDQFHLITNDFEATHQRLLSKDEILKMIREVDVSPEVRNMDQVFNRQKDILGRIQHEQKIVYMLSDFQKNIADIQNDTSYKINFVLLQSQSQRNIGIDSAWFTTPVQMINQQLHLCISVKNYADQPVENVVVTVKLNDQVKALSNVAIDANSTVTDTLSFIVNEPGSQSGEISVIDYPVTFDDIFYFSFQPVSKLPVLSINGGNENQFIQSLYSNNELFIFQNNPANRIEFNNLNIYNLILLNELPAISSGLAQALTEQLQKGVSIIIFPSFDMEVSLLNNYLQSINCGTYGEIVNGERKVTSINTRMKLFSDVFENIPKNLSMPYATKSYSIRAYSRTLEEDIMSFTDGRPMLARYPFAGGAVYLSAVPLNRDVTDLPVQGGLFVPLMYKIAVSGEKNQPLYSVIGNEQWIPVQTDRQLNADQAISVRNEKNEFIPATRKQATGLEINLSSYASEAGIYYAEAADYQQAIALNYDRGESDLSFYTSDELREKYNYDNINFLDKPQQNLSGIVTQLNEGTPLWKLCVIFALIFLAAEIILIRLLP